MTVFTSPYSPLALPVEAPPLPTFLLRPSPSPSIPPTSSSGSSSSFSPNAHAQPIFHPVDATSPLSTRPKARPLSFDDVRHTATLVARAFALHDRFQKGDVVVLCTFNQHDYVAVILGLQQASLLPALCNPSYTASELAAQLTLVDARAIIAASVNPGGPKAKQGAETAFAKCQAAWDQYRGPTSASAREVRDKTVGGIKAALGKLGIGKKSSNDDDAGQEPHIWAWEEEAKDGFWEWCQAKVQGREKEADAEIERRLRKFKSDDDAVLCFSSGTSGIPKAVRISHQGLVSNTIQSTVLLRDRMRTPSLTSLHGKTVVEPSGERGWYTEIEDRLGKEKLDVADREVHLDVLPQFHCYGLLVQLVALHTATPRHIHPRFDLSTFLSTVQTSGVTFAFVVPPILLALAKHPLVDDFDVKSLTKVASGAAGLQKELAERLRKRLGIRCTDGYGMTEMSPIISMQNLGDLDIAPGTVGGLAPNTIARVLSPEGKELGPDEAGELILRGPQMMNGYLRNAEADRSAFASFDNEKWVRTGDVAKIDSRGYITITDRLKDVIKSRGFQVSPAELVNLLGADERVHDVAIVGVIKPEDEAKTEVPWAYIVLTQSLQSEVGDDEGKRNDMRDQIVKSLNGQVAGYKKLDGATIIDALPKSAAGKVLKKDLRQRWAKEMEDGKGGKKE